jgi:regulator of cell morphogenesis and NO signaling
MQTTTEKTVREIAVENPASIRVFETLGIDYCCGGNRTLSEACARVKVEVDRVRDLLDRAARDSEAQSTPEWGDQPLHALIDHIVGHHHANVRSEIPRIESLLSNVVAKHGAALPELIRVLALFGEVGQELSTHMLKEEQVLFPYIAKMEQAAMRDDHLPPAFFGSVARPIANMIADHEDAGALLAQIRELANGYAAPAGACPSLFGLYVGLEKFERDLFHHVHLENNILFPRAIEMERAR